MRKMAKLSPIMNELREKYKDDPQRMNQETMKLYKEYGVNPFGGCLPMLVQIPIFFGFYGMLDKAIELRNSSFLWVHDLSQPDTVFHIGGIPINILPLVMAATQLWQMSITPKTGDPAQQRMFLFMPLIFLFICYNYASGLALYWTVQNLFFVAQMYLTRKPGGCPARQGSEESSSCQAKELSINRNSFTPRKKMEAKEILDTMLGYLGFVADIQEVETESGRQLQVFTAESDALIGPRRRDAGRSAVSSQPDSSGPGSKCAPSTGRHRPLAGDAGRQAAAACASDRRYRPDLRPTGQTRSDEFLRSADRSQHVEGRSGRDEFQPKRRCAD